MTDRTDVPRAWIDSFSQDLRYACRALGHSRGYTAWLVGSLAIGMAVTIAALALLNALLVLPFPAVTRQERLVRVAVSLNCGRPHCWTRMSSSTDYLALSDGLTGLEGLAAYTLGELPVGLPHARSLRAALTSANYFTVLGVRPAAGRVFEAADARTHAAIAVISHSAWEREFEADPSVIGRSIRVADRYAEIVGVAPPLFAGINRVSARERAPEIWLPLWMADNVLPLTAAERRRQERDLAFVGRLEDGFEVAQLHAEAQVLAARLAALRGGPQGALAEVRRVWKVDPKSWHLGVLVVMPIPILVLVIACVNAANLVLARGSQRQREIAIRLAIGAGRGRVVRQLLLESAVVVLFAIAVALPIAWWAVQLARNPLNIPVPFDATVLVLTILTGAVTTIAFGFAPAVRVSAQQPSSALGSVSAPGDARPPYSRLRRLLVVAQVALSLGLLATAWQLVSTVRAQAVSGGTPPDRLLIARFDLQPLGLGAGDIDRFYGDLLAGASRLAGVEAVGVARYTSVWTFGERGSGSSLIVWQATEAPEEGRATGGGYAGGELFEAVGLRLLAGRGFTDADRHGRPRVALVNQPFAQRMASPAVGSIIRVASREQDFSSALDLRIVGVVESALEPRLEAGGLPAAKVYLPSAIESEAALALYVRTRAAATAVAPPVRELVSRIAPRVPILELGSLAELNERSYHLQLWLARAAALLGVIGLVLATAGLYGVTSYVVTMRSREIAIRMAVGARPAAILRMILGEALRAAAIGLVAGGGTAVAVSRYIRAEYHGIHGLDAAVFGGASALFLAAMLLAGAIPAVRASGLDPVEILRNG